MIGDPLTISSAHKDLKILVLGKRNIKVMQYLNNIYIWKIHGLRNLEEDIWKYLFLSIEWTMHDSYFYQ
jgi:hypothetical protein